MAYRSSAVPPGGDLPTCQVNAHLCVLKCRWSGARTRSTRPVSRHAVASTSGWHRIAHSDVCRQGKRSMAGGLLGGIVGDGPVGKPPIGARRSDLFVTRAAPGLSERSASGLSAQLLKARYAHHLIRTINFHFPPAARRIDQDLGRVGVVVSIVILGLLPYLTIH